MRDARLAVALVPVLLSSLGIAAAQNEADVAFLQDGVREIAPTYEGSALVVFGEQAFPVVNGRSRWGVMEPMIAGARMGKGRVVVMGYTDAMEHDGLNVGDTARMITNTLRWLSGQRKSPKIGIYKVPGLAPRIKSLGLEARDIEMSSRNQVDVVVILARSVAAEDIAPLAEYVRAGGGLLTGARSYMLERAFPGVDLTNELPASRLTAMAGIAWAHGEVLPASARGFRVEPPTELSHAGKALAAFEESEAHKRFLSEKEQFQMYAALSHAALDLPYDDTLLLPRLDRALERFQADAVPAAAMPIARDDIPWRLAITRATERLRWAPPDDVRAHPASAEFPGAVPADAPRTSATLRIETSRGRWGWMGTGLYAAPGEVITVRLPPGVIAHGLGLEIGVHRDRLWELDAWSRMPEIVSWKPIRSTQVRAASEFGGGIYIDVPKDSGAGDFDVTISGGVPAPRYVDGRTDLTEWRSSIRNLPAPWAELESDKIILTVPSRFIRDLDDPAALMSLWNQMSDLVCELAGIPKSRQRPERLVTDVQISGGVDHSGYPIMMHLPKALALISTEEILRGRSGYGDYNRSMWGFPHELGHNVQNAAWSFEGSEEPRAQLFAIYVMEKLCHIPVKSNQHGSAEFRAAQMAKYNFAKPNFEQWKGDQWIGLTTYLQLQQEFGWEAFQHVFAQYAGLAESQRPKSDTEKRDQWMMRFSRQVHRNLGPFFQAWGIPTSERARASIADLPAWMPAELPVPNH